MSFQLKECMFCKQKKPLSFFNRNNKSPDRLWAWCKECEKKASFHQLKRIYSKSYSHIVSFSGGKDSTAMLLMMVEKGMPIDLVVYFDVGLFEWEENVAHIESIQKNTGIEIEIVHPKVEFFEFMTKLQPNNRTINGWPTMGSRWCTMVKMLSVRQRLREYRPYIMYIGYACDEQKRINKAGVTGFQVTHDHFQINRYLFVEWGITEKECLKYCKERGYTWGGLYDHFLRVSCWCCPLQSNKTLFNLCKYYPKKWEKLKEWNKKMLVPFKNDAGILDRIECSFYFSSKP